MKRTGPGQANQQPRNQLSPDLGEHRVLLPMGQDPGCFLTEPFEQGEERGVEEIFFEQRLAAFSIMGLAGDLHGGPVVESWI